MTAPSHSRNVGGVRVYTDPVSGRTDLISVTSALDQVGSPDPLIGWAIKVCAETALSVDEWTSVDALKRAAHVKKSEAAERGTRVHEALERAVLTGHQDHGLGVEQPEDWGWVRAGYRFLDEWAPKVEAVEVQCFNIEDGYAGTVDLLAHLEGLGRVICDWKTGKQVRMEHLLQANAYARCQYGVDHNGTKVDLGEVDHVAVVHLREDGSYSLHVEAPSQRHYDTFLHALAVANEQMNGFRIPDPVRPPDPQPLRDNLIRRVSGLTPPAKAHLASQWPPGVPKRLSSGEHPYAQLKAVEAVVERCETATEAPFDPPPIPEPIVLERRRASDEAVAEMKLRIASIAHLPADLAAAVNSKATQIKAAEDGIVTTRYIAEFGRIIDAAELEYGERQSRVASASATMSGPTFAGVLRAVAGHDDPARLLEGQAEAAVAMCELAAEGHVIVDIGTGVAGVADPLELLMHRHGSKLAVLRAGKIAAERIGRPAPRSAADVAADTALAAAVAACKVAP